MRDLDRPLMLETEHVARVEEITEFPLPVAEDWDQVVRKSDKMADVIDRHLDFESKLQGRELRPNTLCPEQKVSLVTDLTAV